MEAKSEQNLAEGSREFAKQRFDRFEAAQYLGVSTVTIDRALAKRQISCFRIGRRVLFDKGHLDEFLVKNEYKAKAKVVRGGI